MAERNFAFRSILLITLTAAATIPGIYSALQHLEYPPHVEAIVAGIAILAASFLLLWACDAAQADVSQALALAAVALIAVLPEYAVDMYFTWQAGKFPQSDYSHYAIANMTGANRLLIGVAWALIAIIFYVRSRRDVRIEAERRLELFFLGVATIYALTIPLKGSLAWFDGVVFIGLYLVYMWLAARRPCTECEACGPAEYLVSLPIKRRRATTVVLFLFAATAIVLNAERFCEGLVGTGEMFGINKFLLVQWLAPIASEAPEFVVALMFAWRGNAGLALGSLLSAKLNQWTLLVGMIPGVFALSSGSLMPPMPMDNIQMQEILLTAAQSLLAVLMLANLRLSLGEAIFLMALFFGQLLSPTLVERLPGGTFMGLPGHEMHQVFSMMYVAAALALFVDRPYRLGSLTQVLRRDWCEIAQAERRMDMPQ